MKTTHNFRAIFSQIDDPRSDINKLHRLDDILLIGIIAVICAADTWKDMETYAKAKEDFLGSLKSARKLLAFSKESMFSSSTVKFLVFWFHPFRWLITFQENL